MLDAVALICFLIFLCFSLYLHKQTYPHTCCSLYLHKHIYIHICAVLSIYINIHIHIRVALSIHINIHIHTRVGIHAEISYNTPLQNHMTYSHAIQHTITYHNASPPLHAVSHFLSRLPLGRLHCQVLLTRLATSRPRMQRFREKYSISAQKHRRPLLLEYLQDIKQYGFMQQSDASAEESCSDGKGLALDKDALSASKTCFFLDGSPAGFYTCLYFDLFISVST